MDPGVHWVKVNLQVRLCMCTLHVIVLSITKRNRHISSKEEVTTAMEDNKVDIGIVQTNDVDEAKHLKLSQGILTTFHNLCHHQHQH